MRKLLALVAAPTALALSLGFAASASASTAPAGGGATQTAVQTVLDRIVGPGNAVVTVTDTVQTSSTATTSVRWGTAAVVGSTSSSTTVPGVGSTRSGAQQNAVGSTTSRVVTPAGALLRRSVAVVVDRRRLGSVTLPALRRLVSAAAGIQPSRGDVLTVTAATFAAVPRVATTGFSLPAVMQADAVPLTWSAGVVIALVVLVVVTRRRPASA